MFGLRPFHINIKQPGLSPSWLTALALCFGIYAALAVLTMAYAGDPCRLQAETASVEPFENDGLYGFRLANGMVLIEPQYAMATAFTDTGIAAVVDEKGWAYIDRSGTVLVRPHVVDNGPDPFSDGLARFVSSGKYGFFDEKGAVVIGAAYAYAEAFDRGFALICADCRPVRDGEHTRMTGTRWGVIDLAGRKVAGPDLGRDAAAATAQKLRTSG